MIHCRVDDFYRARNVALWMLLALKGGYLNAAGFLATGKFVSHVTGFGTQMGVSLAHEEYFFGGELLIIPMAFILGSSVPAWMLERNYSEHGAPKYYQVQFLITLALGVLLLLGTSGSFGPFNLWTDDLDEISLIGLLCFICGMKNGLSTWSTYGKIRTTHLTGLSTDIGLHLPKFFRSSNVPSRFPEKRRVNTVRIMTFISFSSGSLGAAFVFPSLEYSGFVFPFLLSIILSVVSYSNYYINLKRSFKLQEV